jgi:hypothetical protein
MQASARPGDAHVQQSTLLLHRRFGLGIGDRNIAVAEADEEHRVPLEPLRGVQRGEGDRGHRRLMLARRPLEQLADERRERRAGR